MNISLITSLAALIALLPLALLPWRRWQRRDGLFWLLLAVALAATLCQLVVTVVRISLQSRFQPTSHDKGTITLATAHRLA